MAYGKDGWRGLGAAALGLLLGCFESSVAPTTTDASSGGPPGGACIPGETQTCLCVGGVEGVQVCNDQGSGYDDCACVTSTSGGSSGSTTGPPATGTTTSVADTGSSSEGSETTVADTGVLDTGPPPGGSYGPCNDDQCPDGEVCVGDPASGYSICAAPCNDPADCPEPPPGYQGSDLPACQLASNGETVCLLPCSEQDECVVDMICADGFCSWPPN